MKISWVPFLIVVSTHIAAITLPIYYGMTHGFTWAAIGIGVLFMLLGTFSISAGYHRLFAHGTYQAHWLVRLVVCMFGAAALEGSAIVWAGIHRKHHLHTDTEEDPHNIKRSFWWAHVGWVMFTPPEKDIQGNVDDLRKDPILQLQDRFYIVWALLFGVAAPVALGWALGDWLGGLAIGAALRIVVFHHITWFINSAAHTFGTKPFDKDITARDSWVMALLTMGEGYHNYHHAFAYDYRNGVRWWAFDPSKWTIFILSKVGLAKDLVRATDDQVQQALANNK